MRDALNDPANADSMSVCSTDVAEIVQRQLEQFSSTLRRQIERDMEAMLSKKIPGSEMGSQPDIPPPTPCRKKYMKYKGGDNGTNKRKVSVS